MKRWHVWHGGNNDLNFISAWSFVHFVEEATCSSTFQLKLWIWFNWIILLLGFLFWNLLGKWISLAGITNVDTISVVNLSINFDNRNSFDVTNLSPSRITLKTPQFAHMPHAWNYMTVLWTNPTYPCFFHFSDA